MHRRKWDSQTKAKMVIQGLQGKPIAEICNEHQISQSRYYQWRDQFLAHAANAFEVFSITGQKLAWRRKTPG
jgi:transposase-like protein